MKKLYVRFMLAVAMLGILPATTNAQQLPNSDFEDWSGAKFDGNIQPANWNVSNVTQLGFKFNFAYQENGHTGYCLRVQSQEVGAAGITEVSPGYVALGQPWVYVPSLTKLNQATAGTYGGIAWNYRPDTMQVWIRRTGSHVLDEDFNLLYYAWSGTAQGSSYKGKGGGCTSVAKTDEESDIRQALDGNVCTTTQFAKQIAEGWVRDRKEYNEWTCINVPVYYMNSDVPEKCNIIFSASNYPNFSATTGLYHGDALYVDDVRLIYSSTIQSLYIGNKRWNGFNPNTTEEQVYSVGNATEIPDIYAMRGEGTLTNSRGTTANFPGRRLADSEITIQKGTIDGDPTLITVKAEDGSSSTTYKIRFVSKPSDNARLADIQVNGASLNGFNGYVTNYSVGLPYGTSTVPKVTFTLSEDNQTVTCTQPSSVNGQAVIKVVAPDGVTTMTYTLTFFVKDLDDNTLLGINVNGHAVQGFNPSQTLYRVELPLGTTDMPQVEAVSAYPTGAQTITYLPPVMIDGGQYQIAVTTPGNTTPKTYKLNFKITASTNSALQQLNVEGGYLAGFDPQQTTYYITLPVGTTDLPKISWVQGDDYQTVTLEEGGLDGTTRIIVTAASGAQTIYKIVFSTEKSDVDWLNNIYVGGVALEGYSPDKNIYDYELPLGTTVLPEITYDQGDEYQTVTILTNGVDGVTRITVTADNGTTNLYQIRFSVLKATDATLRMIYLDGTELDNFNPAQLEYTIYLPQGTTQLPVVTWLTNDQWQTVTYREAAGLTGDARITVRPQEGSAQTYILHFSVATSANTDLQMIYLADVPLDNFQPEQTEYTILLPMGVSVIPAITWQTTEATQKVMALTDGDVCTVRVTAENGDMKTYTLTFIIQKSENALLKMIYLDGTPLEGFESDKLSGYVVTLLGDKCPLITVDKEATQQVTVMAPAAEGTAVVEVRPETGAENRYIIEFRKQATADVLLQDILLDGISLTGFDAYTTEYTVPYTGQMPVVSYNTNSPNQRVRILRDKNVVTLLVTNATNQNTSYVLTFSRLQSTDASLKSISLNGVELPDYDAQVTEYQLNRTSAQAELQFTYEKNHDAQTVIAGFVADNVYRLVVTAEDQITQRTYTIFCNQERSSDATLQSIALDGVPLDDFDSHKFNYAVTLEGGMALPALSYVNKDGQAVLMSTSASAQQIVVVAEDGSSNIYTINYQTVTSSNALLADILLDGVSLQGFRNDIFHYVDTLAWRTSVVPSVTPVLAVPVQTVTINYSAVDGTTYIHVVAEDQQTTADYTIAFPVRKSANTLLETVLFHDVDFDFDPEQTDYTIALPYQMNTVPVLNYEKQEPEQQVAILSAPVTDTTRLIVTAENGDMRTYKFAFRRTYSDKPNRLQTLLVNGAEVALDKLEEIDETHLALTIPMPYGTSAFTVACLKSFYEQTCLVQPGGIYRPTIITVKSNRPDDPDVIYTITPQIAQQSPAVLKSISIDGNVLQEFNPNQFNYILNRESAISSLEVNVDYDADVTYQRLQNNQWHWQAVVSKDGYTNTYNIYFHYPNNIIPNADFTEWGTAVYNNGAKPIGWQVPADFFNKITVFWVDAKTGLEIKNPETSIVGLETTYWSTAGGALPAIITLGKLSGGLAVANATHYDFYDYISFYNTPDTIAVKYNYADAKGNGALFAYRFQDNNNNELNFDYKQSASTDGYVVHKQPLTLDGTPIKGLNIAVDATSETKGASFGAKLYVDWFQFIYNSRLSALQVNGEEAALTDDNTFTYTFADAENLTLPMLTFTGEVSDQAQQITWSEETQQGATAMRQAQIRNYAEDGTFTDYRLLLTRPLSTLNTLGSIEVGGRKLEGFQKDITAYTYILSAASAGLPDITAIAATDLQIVKMTQNDNLVSISVQPEYGETKTYTITFVQERSSDTTLKSLTAEGITYDAEQHEYTLQADVMPKITFEKQSDGQIVTVENGRIEVVAEDGTRGQYQINLQPLEMSTSGQLLSILVDDIDLQGFAKDIYRYRAEQPTITSFVREYVTDSVVQLITSDSISWTVYGTNTNTYTLVYPQHLSSNTNISALLINGEPYADFLPMQDDYVIRTDETFDIEVMPADAAQTITTSVENFTFVIDVIAADGTQRPTPYTIELQPDLSDVATLAMIRLNGIDLQGFNPETLSYVVELPCDNPKQVEPQMPDITYVLGQRSQTVAIEPAPLGGTSYLVVTSEDGNVERQYELKIIAEPSHNSALEAIFVNGKSVAHFESDVYFYSAQVVGSEVNLQYSAADAFQTVTQSVDEEGVYVLTVTAQDGLSVSQYFITIYQEALSNNAFLQNILLNGDTFSAFDAKSDNFDAKQLRYNINIASGAALPDIYVQLQQEGQTWSILSGTDVDTVRVVAQDGVTYNDYVLNFVRVKSDNAYLSMIYLNGVELDGFDPLQTQYDVLLPVGTTELPVVDVQKAENVQNYETTFLNNTCQCVVTAENGTTLTYKINFTILRSDADTLLMVYEDGVPMKDFLPERFYYAQTLPVEVRQIPELSYDEADRWQTVTIDTIPANNTTTYRFTVVSESGRKNVYTFVYNLQQSAVDTLQAILINNAELEGFSAYKSDYTYYLPAGTNVLPKVDYIVGDRWQRVEVITLDNGDCRLLVTAENGTQRIYTIHFVVALSDNTELTMITYGGKEIANFDGEILVYNISLPYGTAEMPVITFTKTEEGQNVTISVQDWTATVMVIAADGITTNTYTLNFSVSRSDNALLKTIALDGVNLADFTPEVSDYEVILPFGTETLPQITWTTADEQQTVELAFLDESIALLTVTAGNGEDMSEYRITFVHELSPVNTLLDLAVRGITVDGFDPNINEYHFSYPAGTTTAEFFTVDDVTYALADTTATAILSAQDEATITLLITAANGAVNAYVLKQEIALDNNALLADLQVNGITIDNFHPEVFEYEYLLLEGAIMPDVKAFAQNELAQVDITLGEIGGITYIYCTAEDGTEYEYTILFRYAELNTGLNAREGDVIFKHIPGSNQYLAATIRQNVQVAVYDSYGHRLMFLNVPVCDPNKAQVVTDAQGRDLLADVTSITEGAVIDIDWYSTPLFYVFFQNEKTRITSGKFMLIP